MGAAPEIEHGNFHIIFFDGVCNLCNGFVDFILRQDNNRRFRFASLQSDIAREYLKGYPDILTGDDPDSVVLLSPDGEVYTQSDAVLRIAGILGGAWKLLLAFQVLPVGFRNRIYRWVARNRYAWFGKRGTCRIPSSEEAQSFL